MAHRLTPQTLRRLTYFAAIADAGSIRGGAERLGLSVPAVSEALSELEEEMGTTLAVRSTRRLALTDEGRRVQQIAEQTLSIGATLFSDHDVSKPVVGSVAMTAPVELAVHWLPDVLKAFRRQHPEVKLSVSASDQIMNLHSSDYDLAMRASFVPTVEDAGDAPTLPLTLVSTQKHTPVPDALGWQLDGTLLSATDTREVAVFDHITQERKRLLFDDMVHIDNKQVALQMAAQGMGAALVLDVAVKNNDVFSMLECQATHLDFGAVKLEFILRDKYPSRAAHALHDVLNSYQQAD